ncbi:MAG: hypothetical protein WCP39_05130 [Chlamydiota bacterium]
MSSIVTIDPQLAKATLDSLTTQAPLFGKSPYLPKIYEPLFHAYKHIIIPILTQTPEDEYPTLMAKTHALFHNLIKENLQTEFCLSENAIQTLSQKKYPISSIPNLTLEQQKDYQVFFYSQIVKKQIQQLEEDPHTPNSLSHSQPHQKLLEITVLSPLSREQEWTLYKAKMLTPQREDTLQDEPFSAKKMPESTYFHRNSYYDSFKLALQKENLECFQKENTETQLKILLFQVNLCKLFKEKWKKNFPSRAYDSPDKYDHIQLISACISIKLHSTNPPPHILNLLTSLSNKRALTQEELDYWINLESWFLDCIDFF